MEGGPIEFLTVPELLEYMPPPEFRLIGDSHINRGGLVVLAGVPGTGKSRALGALALAGALGKGAHWFGLPVHTQFKTLILQAENGGVRLREEWQDIVAEHAAAVAATNRGPYPVPPHCVPDLLVEWVRISLPPAHGLRFDSQAFLDTFREAVTRFGPHVVAIDPWNRMAGDESAADYRRSLELLHEALPAGWTRPAIVIVTHTRKPRAGERRQGGRALLNVVAGSQVLTAAARSVFILQHASQYPEDTRVVLTCCKNNDGPLGPRTAWIRKNGLFAPDPGFDWVHFDTAPESGTGLGAGAATMRGRVTRANLHELFVNRTSLPLSQAAKKLMERCCVGQSTAYRALNPKGEFGDMLAVEDGVVRMKS